jgi:hypothetical protein
MHGCMNAWVHECIAMHACMHVCMDRRLLNDRTRRRRIEGVRACVCVCVCVCVLASDGEAHPAAKALAVVAFLT